MPRPVHVMLSNCVLTSITRISVYMSCNFLFMTCYILTLHIMLCHVMSWYAMSGHILLTYYQDERLCAIILWRFITCHLMSCHAKLSKVMSCHDPYHVRLCQFMIQWLNCFFSSIICIKSQNYLGASRDRAFLFDFFSHFFEGLKWGQP